MTHPLVEQLRFARPEWREAIHAAELAAQAALREANASPRLRAPS